MTPRHWCSEVCVKADALGSFPTWEEEKMQHSLTLNPRHELSSDIMTDIIRFTLPSLCLTSHFLFIVWNPNHIHLSSTNHVTSRQIEMEWENVDVAHGYFLPECSYQVSMISVLYKQVCGQDNFWVCKNFQQLLLQCSVSHDPSELIWICWFVA